MQQEVKKLFGTDGIRANNESTIFNRENLFRLGLIIGSLIKDEKKKIYIAKDTRASCNKIEEFLSEGISKAGVNVFCLGIMPTPALAYLTQKNDVSFGIMISASHNPASDNGIKVFDSKGLKLDCKAEKLIEKKFFTNFTSCSKEIGIINNAGELFNQYVDFILEKFPSSLKNFKIVLDCANGASFKIAPTIFRSLGAQIIEIGTNPNGQNINLNCGSEYTTNLEAEVKKHHADLGIAFDGDADRAIFVDKNGQAVNGDAIMAVIATHLKNKNLLNNNMMSASIMSSVSLEKYLKEHSITVKRAPVGDKHVAEVMRKEQLTFGGEKSGHLIFSPYSNTGDGILSSLLLLDILINKQISLNDLVKDFKEDNQVLVNIPINQKLPLSKLPKTKALLKKYQTKLKDDGRILFRYSGTEMKLRLLVEYPDKEKCQFFAQDILDQFKLETNTI